MMKIGYILNEPSEHDVQPTFYTEKQADRLDRYERNYLTRILYVELPEE
jgi:hypothetical protein